MSVGDTLYQWIYEEPSINSRSDQLVGVLTCRQKSFSSKILNPNDGGSFILESLTNRSRQVNSRSLIGTCFVFVV